MLNNGLFTSNSEEWETPQCFFNMLNDEYHFTLDPCATAENAKCKKYYTKEQDGLSKDWAGEIVFCNPPYGREIVKWVRKCYEHFMGGGVQQSCLSQRVRILPGSMITFTAKQKSDLYADGCISITANGTLLSHR